jgi:hypothetical protein
MLTELEGEKRKFPRTKSKNQGSKSDIADIELAGESFGF